MANDKVKRLVDMAEDYAFWHFHFHEKELKAVHQKILADKEESLITFVLDNFNG